MMIHREVFLKSLFVIVPVLFLVACSSSKAKEPEVGPASGFGPGISVSEALKSNLDGPLLVNGWIFASSSNVRLCSSLITSTPPACGQPSLEVKDFDLTPSDNFKQEQDTRWSKEMVQVLGSVKDGVLTVAATSR
jgi:hypothetical protein